MQQNIKFPRSSSQEDPFTLAMDLHKAGQHEKAIPYFLRVITNKPKSIGSYLGLARCYQATEQHDKAIAIYLSLREKKLDTINSELGLSRCYQELKQLEQALAVLQRLVKQYPNNKIALLAKACCDEEMAHHHQALKQFLLLKKDYPHDKDILLGLARCYEKTEQYSLALNVYQQLETLHPADKSIIISKARLYGAMNQHEIALDIYCTLEKDYPNDKQILLAKAHCYEGLQQPDVALSAFSQLIKLYPKDKNILMGNARCYQLMEKYDEALQYLEKLCDHFPHNKDIVLAQARCYEEQGSYEQAIILLKQLSAKFPKNKLIILALAHCYENSGQYDAAMNCFQQLRQAFPRDKTTGISEARYYQAIEQYDSAIQQFENLAHYHPQDKDVLLGKICCYSEMGQYQQALQCLVQFDSVYGDDKAWLLAKARCYRDMGSYTQALYFFDKLNQLYPNDKTILLAQALCYEDMASYAPMFLILTQLEQRYPKDKVISVTKARCYTDMGDYSTALTILKSLAKHHPTDKNTLISLARCYENLKQFDEALVLLEQLEILFPNNRVIKLAIICCQFEQAYQGQEQLLKKDNHLIEALLALIKQFPFYQDAYLSLGNLYKRLLQYSAATDLLQNITQRFPYCVRAYRQLARCYIQQGQPALALTTYQNSLKRFSYNRPLHLDYLQCLIELSEWENAAQFSALCQQRFISDALFLADLSIMQQALLPKSWLPTKQITPSASVQTSLVTSLHEQLILPTAISAVMHLLRQKGFVIFLYGGCIRDQLIGLPAKDFDLITNAPESVIREVFPTCQKSLHITNLFTLKTQGLHLDVNHTSLSPIEHAHTLDFTINAFYSTEDGKVFHPLPSSLIDLKNKKITLIGDKERLIADPVRMLRAIYLATKLEFTLEPRLISFIKTHGNILLESNKQRLSHSFTKLFLNGYAKKNYQQLKAYNLMQVLFPHTSNISPQTEQWLLHQLTITDERALQQETVSIFYIYAVFLLSHIEYTLFTQSSKKSAISVEELESLIERELKPYRIQLSLQEHHILVIKRLLYLFSQYYFNSHEQSKEKENQLFSHQPKHENKILVAHEVIPDKSAAEEIEPTRVEFPTIPLISPQQSKPIEDINNQPTNNFAQQTTQQAIEKPTQIILTEPLAITLNNYSTKDEVVTVKKSAPHTQPYSTEDQVTVNQPLESFLKKRSIKQPLLHTQAKQRAAQDKSIKFNRESYALTLLNSSLPSGVVIQEEDRKKALSLLTLSFIEMHINAPISKEQKHALKTLIKEAIYKRPWLAFTSPKNWTSLFRCENYAIQFDERLSSNALTCVKILEVLHSHNNQKTALNITY